MHSSMKSPGNRRRRSADNLQKLPRSSAVSHLYRSAERLAPANYPPLKQYAPSVWWGWIKAYLKYVFNPKHDFPAYTASPSKAVYDLTGDDGSPVRIALAGDWATGTNEAFKVASQIQQFHPHFTIHLGDVYYVGDPPEVNENCLGVRNPENNYDPVLWPIGSLGSFALNGNHEMYANGNAYFDLFLPRLGLKQANGRMSGQQTSFFCLQNRFWRVIAIDTGYNSIGIPILSQIPWINRIPGVGGDCKLHDGNLDWLHEVVLPTEDNRGLVLLAHHQYYSAFEGQYTVPAKQLWSAGVQRSALWFWGHEHRLAGYPLTGSNDLKVFGRCIGHGGMPIELKSPAGNAELAPVFYDRRQSPNGFGFNGSVNLTFQGPRLTANYIDLLGEELLREEWTADVSGIKLQSIERRTKDTNFVLMDGPPSTAN